MESKIFKKHQLDRSKSIKLFFLVFTVTSIMNFVLPFYFKPNFSRHEQRNMISMTGQCFFLIFVYRDILNWSGLSLGQVRPHALCRGHHIFGGHQCACAPVTEPGDSDGHHPGVLVDLKQHICRISEILKVFSDFIQLTELTSEPIILVFLTPQRQAEIKSLLMKIWKIFLTHKECLD